MKQELTPEQERLRMTGLRILARIIVRHRLAHPELYTNGLPENGMPNTSNSLADSGKSKATKEEKNAA